MELGTGIFLASIILGMILLYGQTKDRWNWKKIVRRTMVTTVSLCLFLGLVFFSYLKYEERVLPQSEFLTISINDSPADIKFKKGNPDRIENGKGISVWNYKSADESDESVVLFKGETLRAVLYIGDCTYCNNIYGIGIGTGYDYLHEKLGSPTFVSESADQLERFISYEKLNLVFNVKQNKVIGFGIYNPQLPPLQFKKKSESDAVSQP